MKELKLKNTLNKYFLIQHFSMFFVAYYNTTVPSHISLSEKSTVSKKKATMAKKNAPRWLELEGRKGSTSRRESV